MSLPAGLSAFSIFLGIAAIGFLFLIVSFLFGEMFGHDVGDHGGDVHGDVHGVGFLNSRVLSVFITAFGGFGAIGAHLGYRVEASTGLGLAGGLVFGFIIYVFARFLYGQQASSGIGTGELIGRTAQISVAIPEGGLGQVRCALGETVVEKIARTVDGKAIPIHTSVTIESIVGETVLVRRVD
jgi:hypothetical protein